MKEFLRCLKEDALCLYEYNKEEGRKRMKTLTNKENDEYDVSIACYLCNKLFTEVNKKVHDHCHWSGNYLGPACNRCNLARRNRLNVIPVVFHNFRGYDSHHIIKEGDFSGLDLSVIPTSKEGYLSLRCTMKNGGEQIVIQFVDSLQFLSASLASLASNCPSLPLTSSLPGSAQVKSGKGIFPYNWLDSEDKLNATYFIT